MLKARQKTFTVFLSLALFFICFNHAESRPEKDPVIKKPRICFAVNRPVRFKNSSSLVLAGTKSQNTPIYVNGQLAIPQNEFTAWYFEYTLPQKQKDLLITISQANTKLKGGGDQSYSFKLKDVTVMGILPPRISGIRVDLATKDIILTIQDTPGVLSYNIYYANSLNSSPATSPFILAQTNVPVSGTGTTTWRDNGTYTGKHPMDPSVKMRFYRLEVARVDPNFFQFAGLTPEDNLDFLAGAAITVQADIINPDNDALKYRFSIGGTVIRDWSSSSVYTWQTTNADVGATSVTCDVKDAKARLISKTISCHIVNPAVEDILQKVAENYAKINDIKTDAVFFSTLNGRPLGETEYCRYYFKAPDKEKTETYSNPYRLTKTDIIIVNGYHMYLIDPIKNIKQDIGGGQNNQLDIYYSKNIFISAHTINRNSLSPDQDLNNMIVVLEALPKTANTTYDKLSFAIDYSKGIIIKYSIYRKNSLGQFELVQLTSTIESKQMPNSAWLPVKMIKTPNLSSNNFISNLNYDNPQINIGLSDSEFDPSKE